MFSPFCDAKNQKLNISEILLIKLDVWKILLNLNISWISGNLGGSMGNDIKCMYFNHRFKDKPQGKQCG